jgi:hypothetical protein
MSGIHNKPQFPMYGINTWEISPSSALQMIESSCFHLSSIRKQNRMRNIRCLWYRDTTRLQRAVSSKAGHIRHICSECSCFTDCVRCINCVQAYACLYTHVETVCPDWKNIRSLAVEATGNLVFECLAVREVEIRDDLIIHRRTIKCQQYWCWSDEGRC